MVKVKKGAPAPPPQMEGKPEDVTQYAFAPVCDLDHVTGYGKTEITIKDLEVLTACHHCGRPARYQTVLRTAEAQWCQYFNHPSLTQYEEDEDTYYWRQRGLDLRSGYWWTKAERVRSITL